MIICKNYQYSYYFKEIKIIHLQKIQLRQQKTSDNEEKRPLLTKQNFKVATEKK